MSGKPTKAQARALEWLREHNGSGALSYRRGDKQYLVAGGETAPFMPSSWIALAELGLVTIADGRVTAVSDIDRAVEGYLRTFRALKTRLEQAEWLIEACCGHEGAEGFSLYLHKALEEYCVKYRGAEPIDRN